jgi:hypothetical protein
VLAAWHRRAEDDVIASQRRTPAAVVSVRGAALQRHGAGHVERSLASRFGNEPTATAAAAVFAQLSPPYVGRSSCKLVQLQPLLEAISEFNGSYRGEVNGQGA